MIEGEEGGRKGKSKRENAPTILGRCCEQEERCDLPLASHALKTLFYPTLIPRYDIELQALSPNWMRVVLGRINCKEKVKLPYITPAMVNLGTTSRLVGSWTHWTGLI